MLLCVFLAFYLLPLSYGLMTFFVTTMLGVLYGLLGRFSVAFLEIRLLETAIGAVAGAVAALIVLPTRTRGRIAEQAEAFLTPVAELLRAAADDLRSGADVRPLAAEARDVDTQMHALLLSARPLGSYRFGDARARYERWRLLVSSCATATRGFARVIGPTAVTCDADTRVRLGDLAATVADLADALAVRDPDAATALVRRACEQEGTLVDLVEAGGRADPAPDGDPPAGAAARGAGRSVGRVRTAARRGAGPGGVAGPTLRAVSTTAVPGSPTRTSDHCTSTT